MRLMSMTDDGLEYLRAHAEPLAPKDDATITCWLSRLEGTDQLSREQDRVQSTMKHTNRTTNGLPVVTTEYGQTRDP